MVACRFIRIQVLRSRLRVQGGVQVQGGFQVQGPEGAMIEAKESSKAKGSLKPEDSSYNMIMYYLLGYQLNVHERTADSAQCRGVGGLELSSSARFFGC